VYNNVFSILHSKFEIFQKQSSAEKRLSSNALLSSNSSQASSTVMISKSDLDFLDNTLESPNKPADSEESYQSSIQEIKISSSEESPIKEMSKLKVELDSDPARKYSVSETSMKSILPLMSQV
jgi:hypothetical protein